MLTPGLGRRTGLLAAILVLSSAAACTFATVKTRFAAPAPKENPRVVVVGEIRSTYTTSDKDVYYLMQGLLGTLKESGIFSSVESRPGIPVPKDGIELTGQITRVDPGDHLVRLLWGMGAGQARTRGVFLVRGPEGEVKVDFKVERTYKGGAGIGGNDYVCVEDLLTHMGETVADVVIRWALGESID